ncbi:hypothetical protein GCM10009799_41500 [Nocardiopsis rhodophaea]|uniref:Uncharacterized protein n=1 Tax=Nocardiopsis rhodophaea TaxID=280238 RepID=A0ABN2TH57_9ACTN
MVTGEYLDINVRQCDHATARRDETEQSSDRVYGAIVIILDILYDFCGADHARKLNTARIRSGQGCRQAI